MRCFCPEDIYEVIDIWIRKRKTEKLYLHLRRHNFIEGFEECSTDELLEFFDLDLSKELITEILQSRKEIEIKVESIVKNIDLNIAKTFFKDNEKIFRQEGIKYIL